MHPGPAAQSPSDEARIRQRRRVAQLGVVQRRQVVHRGHGSGAARRGDDEVRPVDDVGRADEPFHRRPVPARPERVEGAGRHGALVVRHSRREVAVEHRTAAPAHRERLHRDTRALGKRAERPAAEDTDAGGKPEERCRVERDPQARRRREDVAQVDIAPSMERIAPVT